MTESHVRKVIQVGNLVVIPLDPEWVKLLNIDADTFFIQKLLKDGIFLQLKDGGANNAQAFVK